MFFNAGDEGELAHAGLIRVTGTTSEALARGLNLVAGERFSGFVGDDGGGPGGCPRVLDCTG